jgi:flavodoxin
MSQIMWPACWNRRATRPEIHNPASLAEVLAEPDAILLVITSTHGAGDVPDNLQPFAKDLAEQQPDLNAFKYGVIALGDRSYDTFCQGGKTLDRLLAECGASRTRGSSGNRRDPARDPRRCRRSLDPRLDDLDRLIRAREIRSRPRSPWLSPNPYPPGY